MTWADALGPVDSIKYLEHQSTTRVAALTAVERHLKYSEVAKKGDYVCGETFTYADMVLYQILHDEQLVQEGCAGLKKYPRLKKLVGAVEKRPNVEAFLQSPRYRG